MAGTSNHPGGAPLANRLRIAAWSAAGALLLLPLVAMRFTDEVVWTGFDFAVFGAMLLAAGAAFEFLARTPGGAAYRAGASVAILTAFVLVWAVGAVGVIGNERDDINLMFAGVLAVGLVGAAVARFRPAGMARAMLAVAAAQVAVPVIGLVLNLGSVEVISPVEVIIVTGVFTALWITAAALFHKAAR